MTKWFRGCEAAIFSKKRATLRPSRRPECAENPAEADGGEEPKEEFPPRVESGRKLRNPEGFHCRPGMDDSGSNSPPPTMVPSVYRDHPPRRSVSPEGGSSKGRSTPSSPVSSAGCLPSSARFPGVPAFMLNGGQLASRYSMLAAQQRFQLDQTSSAQSRGNSPPGIAADVSASDCRLIDYRGAKVAAFCVAGEYLLCLPQAFDLFLKHLVGGLHTVYTKLKRLDITPIVCNVEQVRVLRGLGAIQPGVNRCKLLSCKDFDALYKDCTTAR